MGLATPDLCVPTQYTTKLKQDLQNLKLDSQNLDVLSPDARQDLKALHDSGIEKIQYPRFHGQVSDLGAQRRAHLSLVPTSPALISCAFLWTAFLVKVF